MNTYELDTFTLELLNMRDTGDIRQDNYRTFLSAYNKAYKEICNKRISPTYSESVTLTNRAFALSDLTYRPLSILYITPDYPDFASGNSYAMEQRLYFEQSDADTIVVPNLNQDTCNVTYKYSPDDLVANLVSETSSGNDTPSLITDESDQEALCFYAAYLYLLRYNKMERARMMYTEYVVRKNQINQSPAPNDANMIHGVFD